MLRTPRRCYQPKGLTSLGLAHRSGRSPSELPWHQRRRELGRGGRRLVHEFRIVVGGISTATGWPIRSLLSWYPDTSKATSLTASARATVGARAARGAGGVRARPGARVRGRPVAPPPPPAPPTHLPLRRPIF